MALYLTLPSSGWHSWSPKVYLGHVWVQLKMRIFSHRSQGQDSFNALIRKWQMGGGDLGVGCGEQGDPSRIQECWAPIQRKGEEVGHLEDWTPRSPWDINLPWRRGSSFIPFLCSRGHGWRKVRVRPPYQCGLELLFVYSFYHLNI
jgi:hypothetical protein